MLIKNPKSFVKGTVMAAVFFVILVLMFLPIFNGDNAFRAADKLFNTISKGSTYYIPMLKTLTAGSGDGRIDGVLKLQEGTKAEVSTVFAGVGADISDDNDGLRVSIGLAKLFSAVLEDADDMFHNRGEAVRERYGLEEKAVLYAWWNGLKGVERRLNTEKRFQEAKIVAEVLDRGVAVGYNYYKVAPQKATDRWFILTFALVFYVFYTLWWGFSIFFLFEGIGLQLTAGKKKEV